MVSNKDHKDIIVTEKNTHTHTHTVKCALSSLRQFLAIENPLKMIKNAFYFTLRALFVLKIFKFLSCVFGHVAKR